MKSISTVTVIVSMMIMYSCQPKNEPCPKLPTKNPNGIFAQTPNTLISKDTFDVWVARWDNNYRAYMASDSLHYFDMPLVDLSTIVTNPNVNGARIYMGMAYSPRGTIRPHTMIVGTIGGTSDFSAILDYTHACPDICN